MKTGKLGIIIQVMLTSLTFSQINIPPGDVSGTWLSGTTYYIHGDITVPNDSTLSIEPGVIVEFQGHYALNVQGRLLAIGTENNNITFTIDDTTGFYNPDTTLGGWYGIRFIETPIQNDTSKIIYCKLQYGKAVGPDWFINAGGAMCIINFNKVIISNCEITNCSAGGSGYAVGGALAVAWSDIQIRNNIISNNKADGGGAIHFNESDPLLSNNIFENNSATNGGALDIQWKSHPTFSNDQIINNHSTDAGGAINIGGDSAIVIFNECTISGNSSHFGGAINAWTCVLELNSCDLTDNAASWIGGSINAGFSKIDINNTNFERDTAFVFGGAMGIYNSELTISNSTLIDNSARILGGGIHSDLSTISISNTTFEKDSTGNSGGGIFTWLCHLQVNDCDFIENSALNGGAISSSNSDLHMDSCWFYQNSAQNQGGALEYLADTTGFISISQLEITNSRFEENSASTRCGVALIEQYNSSQPLAQLIIDNCEFTNNNALRVGTLRVGNISNFTLSNSKFIGNSVTQYSASCTFASLSSGLVFNCLFSDNVANGGSSGGVGVANNSEIDIMNCTFVNNSSGSGGGIQVRAGSIVTLTNNILWGNSPDQISLNAANDTSACLLYTNYNNIQFGVDSIHINDTISVVNWGVGNIDSDPLFVDTLNSDFHLQNLSPCIAAGIDSIEIGGLWQYCPSTDIEGNPRPNPLGTMPDMGAYESEFPSGIDDENLETPKEFALFQNYPNPFNPKTNIEFRISDFGFVSLKVYDVLGNEVATLVNEELPVGEYEVEFSSHFDESQNLSSGIYFYQLKCENFIQTKKMILLK